MRPTTSLLLILMLLLQVRPVAAQRASGNIGEEAPATLEIRLADMSGEVARFLRTMPDSERRWIHDVTQTESSKQQQSLEAARWRVRVLMVPLDREISVVLLDGQSFQGKLQMRAEEEFILLVPRPEVTRAAKVRERIRYDAVKDADLPDPPIGKNVELQFANWSTERGRMIALTDGAIVLEVGKDLTRDCSYLDVTGIRTVGMSTGVKIAIGAGVVAALLAVLGYFVIAPATGA